MRTVLIITFVFSSTIIQAQKLDLFNSSVCLDSIKASKDIEVTQSNNRTTFEFRTWGNCNGNFEASFDLANDTLNLSFGVKPIVLPQSDGTYVEMLELADCDCLFDFTYTFSTLPKESYNHLLINGSTLAANNQKGLGEEIEVDLD